MKSENTSRLKSKLRLAILHEHTYEQIFSLRLTPLTVFTVVGSLGILIVVSVTVLIAFTGLREYIPGYPTGEERRMLIRNFQRADSLIAEIKLRDKMISDMHSVLSGDLPEWALNRDSAKTKIADTQNIKFERSESDSLFRLEIESSEKFNIDYAGVSGQGDNRLEFMYFFSPLKGIITNKYGDRNGHFGVDIVAPEGSRVCSILDGTVIFSGWTIATGNVIIIQHDNQLVSEYKHNSKLLKNIGMHVNAGEVIATIGNSGELSTGTHLHFEMWHNGTPLNPENYISFE